MQGDQRQKRRFDIWSEFQKLKKSIQIVKDILSFPHLQEYYQYTMEHIREEKQMDRLWQPVETALVATTNFSLSELK